MAGKVIDLEARKKIRELGLKEVTKTDDKVGFATCDWPEEMVGMLPAEEYSIVLLTDPDDKLGVSMKPEGARLLAEALLSAAEEMEKERGS